MVIYFSGTGNSRWCAQALAHLLGDELLDAAGYIKHGIAAELISDKPWVFVAPTYAWRMPRVFEDFIRSGAFSGSTEAWFVLTCGGDTGNAGEYLAALCAEKGLDYRGVLPVVMPENYVALFSVPGEEKSEKIIAAARPVLEAGAAAIAAGQPFPALTIKGSDRKKSGAINQGFYRFYVSAKKFFVTESCIGCGKCAELCPLNNIRLRDGKPLWGESCTHCMACICRCPAEAIEYGKRSRGKRRYRGPEFTPW